MNIRERLLGIPDLILARRLQMMSKSQLDEYVALLHSFVEEFPVEEAEVRAAMDARDFKFIIKHLASLRETLISIHADELADECWKRLNSFDKDRPDKIEAYVSFLLSILTALSIDIQVAFYFEENEGAVVPSAVKSPKDNMEKIILAVDDDTYFLDTFKAALKDVPCRIIGVTSGLSALGVLNKLKPDLFVLDIEMPGMDGIRLAEEIKALENNAAIIFITGNSKKEYVQKCMKAGASDFIVKPINPSDTVNRIRKFL